MYRVKVIYLINTDDSILAATTTKRIDQCVKEIEDRVLKLTDEGDLNDFLGVNIDRQEDGTMKMSQLNLERQILNKLWLLDEK